MGVRLADGHGVERGPQVTLEVDGQPVRAYTGETVAAALMALDVVETRTTVAGSPRGVFCGMGVCFDCLVVVDGVPNTRACMTWVAEGMDVRRQDGLQARA
jgi:predicted molibdopterin-dependent oxidoreductase YjgC